MATSSGTQQYQRPRKISILANYEKTVISAFKWDCENFLEQFEKERSFNYANFANIWQLNHFTFIYADQTFVGPLKVLGEACFLTVKKYIMYQQSLYIQVGAFYLLYGLYYKQPIEGLVKIRITLTEYKKIKSLMDEMSNKEQYDILYIFAKMRSDNAFLYVAEPKPLDLELNKSVKSLTHLDDTFQNRNSESSINSFQDILEDRTVQDLKETCSEYDALLKKLAGKHPSVTQFKSTIIDDLKEAHSKVFIETAKDKFTRYNPQIKNLKEGIKQKAMKNKKAQYRGSRKCLTAMDLESDSEEYDDDDDEDYSPVKDPRKSPRLQGKTKKGKKIERKIKDLDTTSDDDV